MQAQEEVMGSKDYNQMIKRKRTKRQRPASPLALTMASSSSSTAEGGAGGGGDGVSDNSGGFDRMTTSTTNSVEFTEGKEEEEEEEEDMANCLILLAQGQRRKSSKPVVVATTNKAGLYLYQCKTCNRCFPSFQALGGHRASHKKPKATIEEKKMLVLMEEEGGDGSNNNSTTLSLQISNRGLCSSSTNNKSRVHECSICGAEFTSGQALGGHMRRHRTMPMATSSPDHESQEAMKPRNLLSLDLNLPAPEDDHRESKFPFASNEQVIVFSASPLVDCHY